VLDGEIWNAAVARAPSGMAVWFSPQATQVAAETPYEHVIVLPELAADGPGLTTTLVTSAGYCKVH